MCESSVFIVGENNELRKTIKYVVDVNPIDGKVYLTDLFGNQNIIDGVIKEIRLMDHEIILKESEKEVAKIKGDTDATVAILFGSGENFMLATETSYLGDLLKTVGGTNIATELDGSAKSPYLQFSLEQIVQTNPDYILRFAHGNLEETKKAFDDAFDKNPAYAELDAVKNNKVIDLDSNIFNVSANLNVSEAIKTLGGILYGE